MLRKMQAVTTKREKPFPFVQVCAVSVAWVTSLSRVSDHVHHLSDVVVGVALGAAVGAWAEEVEWQSAAAAGASPEASKDIGQSGRRRQQVGQ